MLLERIKNSPTYANWIFVPLYLSISLCLADMRAFDYQHGTSYIEPLKYAPGFEHFEYVNPQAPKEGTLRFPELGTFDSFNNKDHRPRDIETGSLSRINSMTGMS